MIYHCRDCEYTGEPECASLDPDIELLICPECGAVLYEEMEQRDAGAL